MQKQTIALITGSNRGIGKASAITLAKEGVNIALLARNEDLLLQTKNEISNISPEVKVDYFICDTKSNKEVQKTVKDIEKAFGTIDILVNCAAALPEDSTLENFDDKKLFEQIEVKVAGYIRCAKNVAPIMKKNGCVISGRVIGNCIRSISGCNGNNRTGRFVSPIKLCCC